MRGQRARAAGHVRPRLSGEASARVEPEAVDERSRRIAKWFEVPMLIAALLVIPVIVVEQSDVGEPWPTIAGVLNWAIWIAFAVELVVMLAVVPDKWRWLRSHPLEVVIVLLTPPFLPSRSATARSCSAPHSVSARWLALPPDRHRGQRVVEASARRAILSGSWIPVGTLFPRLIEARNVVADLPDQEAHEDN